MLAVFGGILEFGWILALWILELGLIGFGFLLRLGQQALFFLAISELIKAF